MSGFAIVGPDTAIIIATAINIIVAVSAARTKTALITFGSRILDLPTFARLIRLSPENSGTARAIAEYVRKSVDFDQKGYLILSAINL